VNLLPAYRWLLIPLLVLTLGWKLANRPDDGPDKSLDVVVEFLIRQHFDAAVSIYASLVPVLHANSVACSLVIAQISSLRDSTDLIDNLSKPSDHSFIVYRGAVYKAQPIILTAATYLWFRFLVSIGIATHTPPVLAVITSCDAEQLPWGALSSI
jgi:hypothetical protein